MRERVLARLSTTLLRPVRTDGICKQEQLCNIFRGPLSQGKRGIDRFSYVFARRGFNKGEAAFQPVRPLQVSPAVALGLTCWLVRRGVCDAFILIPRPVRRTTRTRAASSNQTTKGWVSKCTCFAYYVFPCWPLSCCSRFKPPRGIAVKLKRSLPCLQATRTPKVLPRTSMATFM